MNIKELQELVHEEYIKNGYAEYWAHENITGDPIKYKQLVNMSEAGLINTEVAELQEDIRDLNYDHYGEEIADIIIRAMNWASRNGIDVEEEIRKKHAKNMKRTKLHGRKL